VLGFVLVSSQPFGDLAWQLIEPVIVCSFANGGGERGLFCMSTRHIVSLDMQAHVCQIGDFVSAATQALLLYLRAGAIVGGVGWGTHGLFLNLTDGIKCSQTTTTQQTNKQTNKQTNNYHNNNDDAITGR
jgi:hypothetical protein